MSSPDNDFWDSDDTEEIQASRRNQSKPYDLRSSQQSYPINPNRQFHRHDARTNNHDRPNWLGLIQYFFPPPAATRLDGDGPGDSSRQFQFQHATMQPIFPNPNINVIHPRDTQSESLPQNVAIKIPIWAFFVVGVVLFWFHAAFIGDLIGLLYPGWKTFDAIESKKSASLRNWLSYWMIFAVLSLIKPVFSFFRNSFVYIVLSISFQIYLLYDDAKNSLILYETFIQPLLLQHAPAIRKVEKSCAKNSKRLKTVLSNWLKDVQQSISSDSR